jgi:hypothetical protein
VPGRLYEALSHGVRARRRWPLVVGGLAVAAGLAFAVFPRSVRRPPTVTYAIGPARSAEPQNGPSLPSPVMAGATLRFSEGTVVTFRRDGRGRVVSLSSRGGHVDVLEGRARALVAAAPQSEWYFSAGPYRVEVQGTELEVGWLPQQELFTLSLFSGKTLVRGPGIEQEVRLRPGESLLARASDGFVQVARGRGALSGLGRPDVQLFSEALGAVADEAARGAPSTGPGGAGGVQPAFEPALSRATDDDPRTAGDTLLPAREAPGVSCDAQEPSLLALAVPDPGPVSLATCRHVEYGASGKDVRAQTQSELWVKAGPGGCLRYAEDIRGNRVPDFSHAGYRGGGAPLPRVAAAASVPRLLPSDSGDDTPAIQAAIDAVSALAPDARGIRGAVELGSGSFVLRGSLHLDAGGVILRGQGSDGEGATVLRAVGPPRLMVRVGPRAKRRLLSKSTHAVTDVYVPVGARTFTLDDTADLKAGDDIVIHRPKTQRWICAIGTDVLPSRKDGRATPPWRARGALTFERRIVSVDGNRVTVDAPLTNALEKEYTQAFVTRLEFPERITEVGVEHLSTVGDFTNHLRCPSSKSDFLRFLAVANGWVKNVRVQGYAGEAVTLDSSSKWVTVEDTTYVALEDERCDDQWAFKLGGQQNLILRGRTLGSYLTALYTDSEVEGPNAVVDFLSIGRAVRVRVASRWSTGILFDNVRIQDAAGQPSGDFDLARGRSSHGWSAVNSVVWNSEAETFSVDNPPTANNWIMGGATAAKFLLGTGTYSAQRGNIQPQSLYKAQLGERLARAASPPTDRLSPPSGPLSPSAATEERRPGRGE